MLQHTPKRSPLLRALPPSYVFGDTRRASVGDANADELEAKVNALADKKFGGHTTAHIKKLFLSYDGNGDGCANRDEVTALLKDADVGNWITRGYWVDGVFDKLDANKNDCITWDEYRLGSGIKDDGTSGPPVVTSDKDAKDISTGITKSDPTAWPTPANKTATGDKVGTVKPTALSTYGTPALAGLLGALWLGPAYGIALGLGWLAAGRFHKA